MYNRSVHSNVHVDIRDACLRVRNVSPINHAYTRNFTRRCRNFILRNLYKYSCNCNECLYRLVDFYYFFFKNTQTQAYLSYRVFIISKIEYARCYFSLFLFIIFLLFRILPTSSRIKITAMHTRYTQLYHLIFTQNYSLAGCVRKG